MISLDTKQLKDKPRKIGDLKGEPVFEVCTKGGLFLVMAKSAGRAKTLGVGAHPATARHIAEKEFPDLNITELSKSEPLPPNMLREQLQESLWLTRKIQAITAELDGNK